MTQTLLANVDLEAAYREAEEQFRAANPTSGRIHRSAAEVMPGGNTRTVIHYAPYPLTFARGDGARLWDADGHELVDFLGEYTAGLYGHNNKVIEAAIETALKDGVVLGGPNLMEARLARAMVERFPALELVRFTNSGTEANLMAVSAARAATGRDTIMVADGGYHGGVFYFAGPTPLNAPFPTLRIPYNDPQAAEEAIAAAGDRLACVIIEPMMGSAGCIPGDPAFLATLRRATEAVGALLIFDEVMTSRLSPGGLHGKLGITPDLVSFGKYIGGGLTCGAFGGRADLMEHFDPRRPDAWPHAGTFNNNVLTMAAGLAGLTRLFTPEAAETLNGDGDAFRARLNAAIERRGLAMQATGLGSMTSIHFRAGRISRPRAGHAAEARLRDLLHLDMIRAGVYLARRGMMNCSLPLTPGDYDTAIAAFEEFLDSRRAVIEQAAG